MSFAKRINRLLSALLVFVDSTCVQAQTLGKGADVAVSFGQLFVLFIILTFIVGGAFLLIRLHRQHPLSLLKPMQARRMKLIEALRFGPHSSLCLVSVDGKEMLITFTPNGASIIAHEAPVDRPVAGVTE